MKKTSVAQQTSVAQHHPTLPQKGTKHNSSKKTQLQGWGILILRVLTGHLFLAAGAHKFFYDDLGPLGSSLSLVELLFGAALIVGLLTRWVSIPLATLMLADIFLHHPPSYLFEQDPGYESALLRLAACTTLAITGSGKVALDDVVASRKSAFRPRGKLVIVVGLVVIAALGASLAVVLFTDRQEAAEPAGVQSFENLSRNHTEDPVTYEQSPPVGGDHYPIWQNAGFYEEPVQNEKAVHTMEHGAVWITYEPDLPEDQKEELRQIVESQECLLASPYPDLPTPVVASAWGKQLRLQSVDDPGLRQFIQAYRKGPQTPEPGASCTGAP